VRTIEYYFSYLRWTEGFLLCEWREKKQVDFAHRRRTSKRPRGRIICQGVAANYPKTVKPGKLPPATSLMLEAALDSSAMTSIFSVILRGKEFGSEALTATSTHSCLFRSISASANVASQASMSPTTRNRTMGYRRKCTSYSREPTSGFGHCIYAMTGH
jgi:hypothetical protein